MSWAKTGVLTKLNAIMAVERSEWCIFMTSGCKQFLQR
jgi:hypothetical protein